MAREIKLIRARSEYKLSLVTTLGFKPIRLFCEHCGKYVASDMEWKCSHCEFVNENTRYYSFLNKCKHCKKPQQSFTCPNVKCGKINFLDKEKDGSHPVTFPKVSYSAPTPTNERTKKIEDHLNSKEELERQITLAKLNAELKKWNGGSDNKSAREKLKASFEEAAAQALGVHEIADHELAAKQQEHKDNPVALQRAEKFINDWRESQLL